MSGALALTIALSGGCQKIAHEPEMIVCRCECYMLCVLDAKNGGKQQR
jgi:hypothetical protein